MPGRSTPAQGPRASAAAAPLAGSARRGAGPAPILAVRAAFREFVLVGLHWRMDYRMGLA
eukprot:5752547-Pyramimonas_sp.AAC.1